MAKVDGKATISDLQARRRLSQLLCNQQRQKLPPSIWGNLALSIMFASSGAAWFSIGNGAAIAANPGTCQLPSPKPRLTPAEPGWDAPLADGDSELGILRVRELEVQLTPSDGDSELGTLRVREPEVEPPRSQPTAHLLAHVGYFQTNNVFSGVEPVDDSLISSGLTLWAGYLPEPKTQMVLTINGNLIRYVEQSEFNYNQFRFRAGIRQRLTPRMYGEIGWNNQQLFRAGKGDRFLNEHSIRLAIYRRDRLTDRLRLDSLYEFRLSNANPDSRSRMINSLSVSLSYYIQRNLQVGLDYQFALSDFTQREREDQYHRLLGRLTFAVSRDSQISVQSGLSLGSSSNPNIDFDNFFFSVNYTMELGEF